MITSLRHVGLVVNDLEAALKFWCGAMGFVVTRQMEEFGPHIDAMMGLQDVRVTTSKLSAPDGNILELLSFHSHPDKTHWAGQPYSTGLTHIALTVSDLNETFFPIRDCAAEECGRETPAAWYARIVRPEQSHVTKPAAPKT